jgi:signal recognition particle subunit SRP54
MGPLDEIMKMIPGMANNPALQNVNMNPKDMDHLKAIIYSMTEQERTDPDVMNPSRRRRISRGSGRPIQEVNRMIKQFGQMKTMMNKVSKGNMSGMENMMGQTGMGGKLSKLAMKQFGRKMKKNKKKRLKKKRKKH